MVGAIISPQHISYEPPRFEVKPRAEASTLPERELRSTSANTEPLTASQECTELTPECSCIVYLQQVKGLPIKGDAVDLVPTHSIQEAEPGDILLINYGDIGHAAYIEYAFPQAVYVSQGNLPSGEISEQSHEMTDPRIRGIIKLNELD